MSVRRVIEVGFKFQGERTASMEARVRYQSLSRKQVGRRRSVFSDDAFGALSLAEFTGWAKEQVEEDDLLGLLESIEAKGIRLTQAQINLLTRTFQGVQPKHQPLLVPSNMDEEPVIAKLVRKQLLQPANSSSSSQARSYALTRLGKQVVEHMSLQRKRTA